MQCTILQCSHFLKSYTTNFSLKAIRKYKCKIAFTPLFRIWTVVDIRNKQYQLLFISQKVVLKSKREYNRSWKQLSILVHTRPSPKKNSKVQGIYKIYKIIWSTII